MDPERWQRLSPLLDALLELDPETRARRLDTMRSEDAALADDLSALMALDDAHADFMAAPLVNVATGPAPGATLGPLRL